jgi:hypothetical protein
MTFEEALTRPTKWLLWQVLQRFDAQKNLIKTLFEQANAMDAQTKQELDDLVTNTANLDDSIKAFVQATNARFDDIEAQLTEALTAKADLAELQDLVHTSVAAAKVSEDDALEQIKANTPAS